MKRTTQMIRAYFLSILLATFLLWTACSSMATPPNVDEIVDQLEAQEQEPYHAVIEWTTDKEPAAVIELWVQDQKMVRLHYRESPALNLKDALLVQNGDLAWDYLPAQSIYFEGRPDSEVIGSIEPRCCRAYQE